MLSPEIKELCEYRKRFATNLTDLAIATAALELYDENVKLREALLEIKYLIGFESSMNDLTAKLTRILGSLPLAGDAPSVSMVPNESQPVP